MSDFPVMQTLCLWGLLSSLYARSFSRISQTASRVDIDYTTGIDSLCASLRDAGLLPGTKKENKSSTINPFAFTCSWPLRGPSSRLQAHRGGTHREAVEVLVVLNHPENCLAHT